MCPKCTEAAVISTLQTPEVTSNPPISHTRDTCSECDMTSYVPTVSNCIIISIIIIYLKQVQSIKHITLSKQPNSSYHIALYHIYRQNAIARCKVDV